MIRLRRLTPTICAFHLGFSLGVLLNDLNEARTEEINDALRRGFKSEAERIARNVRVELGMNAAEPVSPEALAELLGIEVRAGDDLVPRERFLELEEAQPGAFSACTPRPSADRVVIVCNPFAQNRGVPAI